MPDDVRSNITKLFSVSLCSNVIGQFATSLMVKPPAPDDPSGPRYHAERDAILDSLYARAQRIARELNELPGITCNAAEGAMYLFPSLLLPKRAVSEASRLGMAADEFYCIKLLESTGLVVVPGSGFQQVAGTYHFRTTFLPPDSMLDEVLPKLKSFQESFLAQYTDGPGAPAAVEQPPSSAEITPESTPKPTGQGTTNEASTDAKSRTRKPTLEASSQAEGELAC